MAALFSAGVPNSARSNESKNLIEFKAGKMELKGTKVVADKRKGTFYIHKERETMLTHVCWKDRSSGVVEDDLIGKLLTSQPILTRLPRAYLFC